MTNKREANNEGNVIKISCWLPSKGECSDGKLKEKTNKREANDEGGLPLKGECNEGKGN